MISRAFWRVSPTVALALMSVLTASSANGASITVDELLYQGNANNPTVLSGSVDMTLSGNLLTVVLTNTSSAVSFDGNGAFNLLTGLAFNLPSGVGIASGTATVPGGATNLNFSTSATNVGSEWGYFNGTPSQGHWNSDGPAVLTYNTILSALIADTTGQGGAEFAPAAPDLGPPSGLDGPDFGLLSSSLANGVAGGLEAIKSPITFVLTLTGTIPLNLLSQIESNPVGISFASPTAGVLISHSPEPASLVLAGIACVTAGCGFARRRFVRERP